MPLWRRDARRGGHDVQSLHEPRLHVGVRRKRPGSDSKFFQGLRSKVWTFQVCLPWDHPTGRRPRPPVCNNYVGDVYNDSLGAYHATAGHSASADCATKCLPNCEKVAYAYTDREVRLDVDDLCREGNEARKVTEV